MECITEDIARIADLSCRHYVVCRERGEVTGSWWESDLTVTRRGRVYPVGTLVEHTNGVVAVMSCARTHDMSYTRKAWARLESLFGYPELPAYEMPRTWLQRNPTTRD